MIADAGQRGAGAILQPELEPVGLFGGLLGGLEFAGLEQRSANRCVSTPRGNIISHR